MQSRFSKNTTLDLYILSIYFIDFFFFIYIFYIIYFIVDLLETQYPVISAASINIVMIAYFECLYIYEKFERVKIMIKYTI